MADKQYYVKVTFEFGVDGGDGTFTPKNDGSARWVSMDHDSAVGLENYAIIPALNLMNTKAGELGLMVSGIDFDALGIESPVTKTPPGQANK